MGNIHLVKLALCCLMLNSVCFSQLWGLFIKGAMSWPFLLILIPLLRSTRINVHCAMFQTHIGFSYSISVKYVFTLCPKRLVGAPAPPPLPVSPVCSDWSGRCEASCCEERTGFRVGDTARHNETHPEHTHTHSRSKNNKWGLILSKKKVYNAVRMGLRAFIRDPNLVARKTFTHLNRRGRYLVCFKHHK